MKYEETVRKPLCEILMAAQSLGLVELRQLACYTAELTCNLFSKIEDLKYEEENKHNEIFKDERVYRPIKRDTRNWRI